MAYRLLIFTETREDNRKLSSPGDQKESIVTEGEIKYGQLQFMICDNPVTLEDSKTTTLSELRQFRLTKDSLGCFKKDSQVH